MQNEYYSVIRPLSRDYLIGFDADFGTVCRLSGPLMFPSLSAASAAARKARRTCMGWNTAKNRPRRARVMFAPKLEVCGTA